MYYIILLVCPIKCFIEKYYEDISALSLKKMFSKNKSDIQKEQSLSELKRIIKLYSLSGIDWSKDEEEDIYGLPLQSLLAFYKSILDIEYPFNNKLMPEELSLPFFANKISFKSFKKTFSKYIIGDLLEGKALSRFPNLIGNVDLFVPFKLREVITFQPEGYNEPLRIGSSLSVMDELQNINKLLLNNSIDVKYSKYDTDADFVDNISDEDDYGELTEFFYHLYTCFKTSIEQKKVISFYEVSYSKE